MQTKYNGLTINLLIAATFTLSSLFWSSLIYADNSQDTVTAAYLYKLAEKIQWPNQGGIAKFHFHIMSKDKNIYKAMQSVARIKQLHGKPINVSHSSSIDVPAQAHVVFVSSNKTDLFPEVFTQLEGLPILVISEELTDKRLVMINIFKTTENRARFEINKANIINQNLGIDPDIILLGGTEIDVAKLYKKGQQELSRQSQQLAQLQKDVVSIQDEKEKLKSIIDAEKREVEKWALQLAESRKQAEAQNNKLKLARVEVNQLQQTTTIQKKELQQQADALLLSIEQLKEHQEKIQRQQQLINDQQEQITRQEEKFNTLQIQITKQESDLKKQTLALQARESELNKQQTEIDKRSGVLLQQAEDIRKQDIIINKQETVLKEIGTALANERQRFILASVTAVLIFLLSITLFVSNRQKKQTNLILNEQKQQLEQAATELAKAKEIAEKANLAKSTFLANMSHELRTPLNAILGFTQILLNQSEDSDEQHKHLLTISTSGEYLLELINNILDISKIEAGHIQVSECSFNIQIFLEDIIAMFEPRVIEHSTELKLDIDETLPKYIETDEGKLRQIIINLMANALKFTKQGAITLHAKMDREQRTLSIAVEDTGIGIPAEDQAKIFEAFEQSSHVSHDSGGTGLGLTISRKFARLMDGDITAQSEYGKGSIFTLNIKVKIPKRLSQTASGLHKKITGISSNVKPPCLLVVDDVATNREVLIKQLQLVGFMPYGAASGDEALELIPTIDPELILLDKVMPDMDGIETVKQIKANPDTKHIPVVFVSASTLGDEKQEAFSAGADGYISKPINYDELFNIIADHLDIEYQYKEDLKGTRQQLTEGLKPDDLKDLSEEWLEQFTRAVRLGDMEEMLAITNMLPAEQTEIKTKINNCIQEFKFQDLINILKNEKEN
jgi:signal transduction histidine kinase/DNA-binding NarL/FixJ family response regulator